MFEVSQVTASKGDILQTSHLLLLHLHGVGRGGVYLQMSLTSAVLALLGWGLAQNPGLVCAASLLGRLQAPAESVSS